MIHKLANNLRYDALWKGSRGWADGTPSKYDPSCWIWVGWLGTAGPGVWYARSVALWRCIGHVPVTGEYVPLPVQLVGCTCVVVLPDSGQATKT